MIYSDESYAAQKALYKCPDLYNKSKQKLKQMSQGYDGWFFRPSDLRQDFTLSQETKIYFERLNYTLKQRGVTLIFVPLPTRPMAARTVINKQDPLQANYNVSEAISSYNKFVEDIRSKNILVPDLYKDSSIYNINGINVLSFKRDIHWLALGAEIIAKLTSQSIQDNLSNYSELSKINAVSKKIKTIPRGGSFITELRNLCGGEIETEYFDIYKTTRVSEKNADALFGGNNATNPIALVGTSFSAINEFNFSGFLEESSDLEVVNFAIAGGGLFSSIISYLSSPYFQNNIPPVLIWEAQASYEYNKNIVNYFRQTIPAIYGECSAKDAIVVNKLLIKSGVSQVLLKDINQKTLEEISGKNYYLYINSNNIGFNKFTLEMDYSDGDGEWFMVNRSDRYNNQGRFFIELSDEIESNLSSISIDGMENINTSLEVRLCRVPKNKDVD